MAKKIVVDAEYDYNGRAVCPLCFSLPSIQKRIKANYTVEFPEEYAEINGEKITVTTLRYPCSNDDCPAIMKVRSFLGGRIRDAFPPWLDVYTLTEDRAALYERGTHDSQGVWIGLDGHINTDRTPDKKVKTRAKRK